MLEPFIPMRRVFTRVSLERGIHICAITFWERMLITLPSPTNTQSTRWLERIVEMAMAFSYEKYIPSLFSKVKMSSYKDLFPILYFPYVGITSCIGATQDHVDFG